MLEKRGISIYEFSEKKDKKEIEKILEELIMRKSLVPIIGSGFTRGLRTRNGIVPSVDELKAEMISIMCNIDGSDGSEFEGLKLVDLADEFWEEIENNNEKKHKRRFQEYMESNFTKVYDVEQCKRHFLNSNWPTIFTLNYDDAIESVIDINVAIPYDRFSSQHGKTSLIKLHGDAKRYVMTEDSKYCVLGNQQYVKLIKDKSNEDVVLALENTLFSQNIVYVGCSLDNELDLLYSAGMNLESKVKKNKEHHIIYLSFDDAQEKINPIYYKKYGITDVIRVNQTTITDFYELIYEISQKSEVLREKDMLKEYTDIRFEYLDERNNSNLDYLFYNDRTNIVNGVITFPAFMVERSCGNKVEHEIMFGESVLNIVCGTKFSGKTYVLLQLLKNLTNKKVYYFPSYITLDDEVVKGLLEKENAVLLIDDKAISFEQYKNIIIPTLKELEEKNSKIVLTIDKGDAEFYRYYRSRRDINDERIKLYELDNKFNNVEQKEFNEKIGKISLVTYKKNDTLLDYLFKVDENLLNKKHKNILPQVNFLSNNYEKQVRTLIILATNGSITSDMALRFGVDDVLYELSKNFSITVQKDYLSYLEKEGDVYSGFKFVLNSFYWAFKCLSNFAINSHNRETIVLAYRNIVNAYSGMERYEMNNRIKKYYMLDKIQPLFANHGNKGTIRLPYMIYEGLHATLNWNNQFLHQEAKCELRVARREENVDEKQRILELAYRNIGRALDISGESKSENVEYTIAHMNVTKALILINYIFSGDKEKTVDAIKVCYQAFVLGESLCPQLEKEEIKDVKKFIESVWCERLELGKDVKKKFDELYSLYTRKPNWAVNNV